MTSHNPKPPHPIPPLKMDLSKVVLLNSAEGHLPKGQKEGDSDLEFVQVLNRPWQYRGEGNANIVLALQDELRVIRLGKMDKGGVVGSLTRHKRKVQREVNFANNFFIPFLGVEYVGKVQAVQLGHPQIDALNQLLLSHRPRYRLHKELRVPFATAHRDFARIHPYPSSRTDYCIEIKPKQGWRFPEISKERGGQKACPKLCTYCLNQFLKLKKSKISSRTQYCPLDLFSGEPSRMIQAITALISNPQNNLRMFRNGSLVYGDSLQDSLGPFLQEWIEEGSGDGQKPSNLCNFIFLVCMALLKPKRRPDKCGSLYGNPSPDPIQVYETLKEKIRKVLNSKGIELHEPDIDRMEIKSCYACSEPTSLPGGSILDRILGIQSLAGSNRQLACGVFPKICPTHQRKSYCDFKEELSLQDYNLSSETKDSTTGVFCSCSACSCDDDESLEVKEQRCELLEGQFGPSCPSPNCLKEEKWLDEVSKTCLTEDEINSLKYYLLAATAKDCSIMITFSPVRGHRARELSLMEAEVDSVHSLYSPTSPSISNYKDSDIILEDLNGTFHRVRIGVADLDPKPVTSIVKHFLRDREMNQDFRTLLDDMNPPR